MNSLGTDFDTLLTRGALWLLAAAVAWAVAVLVAVGVEAVTAERLRVAERIGCPAVLRAWLLAVFVALFAAAPADAGDPGSGSGTPTVTIDGLPLPDRTTGAGRSEGVGVGVGMVVVRPGDSLWRITRRLLPAATTDASVATGVARLYAANRRAIGPDPDLLVPGQHVRIDALTSFPDPTTPTEAP